MIERCRDTFPIRMMCRTLKVSASGYYSWRDRPLSDWERDNQRLLSHIQHLHAESDEAWAVRASRKRCATQANHAARVV